MKIAIVGHGPSPMGKKLGSEIDSHDVVVRLKNCAPLIGTEDYGNRTDALCLSTEVVGLCNKVMSGLYWLYPKKGDFDIGPVMDTIRRTGALFMIAQNLTDYWNDIFRKSGAHHPNVSTGLAAIIMAAHYYEPQQITLIGFDTLLNPKEPFLRNDASPRTGVGVITHDWQKENELLYTLADQYRFQIGVL
jgi:hypothetical protein